jgi:XTP/dITP diphosphohydrolase
MDIVLATRNRKKAEELRRITADMPVSVLTLDDFTDCPETEEDGATFEANAVKKAVEVARCTGKPALADDSGLEVYALGGAPGVFSARYSGAGATDSRNSEKLLTELRSVEQEKRGARFVCCIALAFTDGSVYTFRGHAEGAIGTEPRGVNGFGYDPLFYPLGSSRTFAEMNEMEKDAISHRGKALRSLHDYLNALINR